MKRLSFCEQLVQVITLQPYKQTLKAEKIDTAMFALRLKETIAITDDELYKLASTIHPDFRKGVLSRLTFGGTTFYEFDETPEGTAYLCTGFKPLRNLN